MRAEEPGVLPEPSQEEVRHSRALIALLTDEARAAGGWLSFERFMELALYAPGLGYYSAGSVKLGAAGDFVTAPESSELFGRCLARQCDELLGRTGGDILELGAGSGRLATTLLSALAEGDALPERYLILEVSADLAERQQRHLEQLPPALRARVHWLTALPEPGFRGVMLANEVADALPCRRFVLARDGVNELGVTVDAQGELHEEARPAAAVLLNEWRHIEAELPAVLPEGYRSEVCLRANAWIASLADALGAGALLVFDYGLPRRHYYHPQRLSGTLRCHFRHRAHDDPYRNVGLQDITAWVDFTRLAQAGADSGLEVAGFATQAAFLLATGLDEQVAAASDPRTQARLSGEARRLVMPEEMGEAFKVLALTRGSEAALSGFALQDLRHLL
jgi:SAM-dependent MidA family methyltransferase